MDNGRMVERRERFSGLIEKASDLNNGRHDIKVAKVLDIGVSARFQPEVAIIRDHENRILIIPEDRTCDGHNRLVSRWNVKKGMALQLVVNNNEISEVLIRG